MGAAESHIAVAAAGCTLGALLCTEGIPSLHSFSPIELPLFPHPPPTYSLHSKHIYVTGTASKPIVYWHKQSGVQTQKSHSRLLVLYFHGNGDDIGEITPCLNQMHTNLRSLASEFHTVAIELAGYGATLERVDDQQMKKDSVTLLEILKQNLDLNDCNIIVIGRSIGTGLACHLAALYPRLHSLVLISPFFSLDKLVRERGGRFLGPLASMLVSERFPNAENLKESHSPLLLLHGKSDTIISPDHSRELYEISQSKPKQFHLISGDHNTLRWSTVCDEVHKFLSKLKHN